MLDDRKEALRVEENLDLLSTPLTHFSDLSPRTINALGIAFQMGTGKEEREIRPCLYLGDLISLSEDELRRYRNLGQTCILEIAQLLHRLGLTFEAELAPEIKQSIEALPRDKFIRISGDALDAIRNNPEELVKINRHLEALGALTYPPAEIQPNEEPSQGVGSLLRRVKGILGK